MKSTVKNTGIFGGAKPRRPQALFLVLVVVGMLSLAGVVSADNYWKGLPPVTGDRTGSVTGDVDVQFADTWTSPDNIVTDSNWANFTLQVPQTGTLKFARLYVVVYSGNMTANFKGNETIKLYNSDVLTETLADHQPLDISYINTSGIAWNSSVPAPFTSLSRDTSDYLNVFDVKNYVSSNAINVHIQTWNESLDIDTNGVGKFDGRIKEAKLVYGWDDSSSSTTTRYWINEGQDPSTKYDDAYVGETDFNGVPTTGISSATLYTDDIASANGAYAWADPTNTITPTTTIGFNSYARLNEFDLDVDSIDTNNPFYYDRFGTNSYYKLALAILKIKY